MQPTPDAPRSRVRWVLPAAVVLVLAVGLGWAFQPWTLFWDNRVTEAMPGQPATVRTSASPAAAASTPTPRPTPSSTPSGPTPQPSPECSCDGAPKAGPSAGPDGAGRTVLRTGFFIDQEHPTSGTVTVIQLADGQRFLRLQDLSTRNGPALRVWLSTESARAGQDTWASYGQSDHRDLGPLKGNQGNQNYEIPADVDLNTMVSVTVWSQRYSVAYGAAALQR